jgi:hypothetical protein
MCRRASVLGERIRMLLKEQRTAAGLRRGMSVDAQTRASSPA